MNHWSHPCLYIFKADSGICVLNLFPRTRTQLRIPSISWFLKFWNRPFLWIYRNSEHHGKPIIQLTTINLSLFCLSQIQLSKHKSSLCDPVILINSHNNITLLPLHIPTYTLTYPAISYVDSQFLFELLFEYLFLYLEEQREGKTFHLLVHSSNGSIWSIASRQQL